MSLADLWLLVLSVVLVLLAGLLVSAETAIGRVSRGRIEELRRENPRAVRLIKVLDDRPRYINVLLFLSTLATVTSTVLLSFVLVDWLTGNLAWPIGGSIALAVVIMVITSYVALGVAPRTLGRQHAERIALSSARPAQFFAALLGPLTSLLIVIGNALTPGKGYRDGPFATQAELRELVDMAEADSLIEDEERQMIHSVFELGDTFVKEVMVPRTEMVFIERTKSIRQAMSLALRSGFSRIPVIGENADDIVGIIYLKDVMRRSFEHHEAENSERVESLMRTPYFVPDSKPVDALLRDMQSARVHMAVAVDEYGGTAGIVTIEDILEEIVGEIADEYDTAAPDVDELDNGSYRLSSRLHVEDFAELIGVEIDAEQEGVDTVLGLMAKRLGRVPLVGSSILVGGFQLTAERGTGRRNRVSTILVVPVSSDAELPEADDE
jgi:CBS domain containing-hemolysin-like protein